MGCSASLSPKIKVEITDLGNSKKSNIALDFFSGCGILHTGEILNMNGQNQHLPELDKHAQCVIGSLCPGCIRITEIIFASKKLTETIIISAEAQDWTIVNTASTELEKLNQEKYSLQYS